LTAAPASPAPGHTEPIECYALLGNPNTGKTTLFNRLCGLRAKTANFPGSTVEARIGPITVAHRRCEIVDLPGIYGLNLDRPESRTCKGYLAGEVTLGRTPQATVVVLDATNLQRNLLFASQALQQGVPAVIALNMIDLAERRGMTIRVDELARRLGCPVIPISARSGDGVPALLEAMDRPTFASADLPDPTDARAASAWADETMSACVAGGGVTAERVRRMNDRLDGVLTHPVAGLAVFVGVMTGLFFTIFTLAAVPMDLIELLFSHLGSALDASVPPGAIHDLLVDGVVAGVAGTVVFLPQICLLFFLIAILEDTGYLARAVFVVDRWLRRFGLPGQAFVPLLSAHACAIPAIMSARLIPDHRDRVATVLVAPFMSCSARLPVYVLLVGVLFIDRPLFAGLAFAGCYLLGAAAALLTALVARRSILRGPSRPMVLELPDYRLPSLRSALVRTVDRGWMFLRKAGTVILAICIVLWWLTAYPKTTEPATATALRAEAAAVRTADPESADRLEQEADGAASRHALSESFAGRLGHAAEPAFAPIGLDWQLSIGVLTSFAAREVFVSTLAVLFAGTAEADDNAVLERISAATREDGSLLLTPRTAASLLVFYVLAMQCLPTLPVTAREAGHWGWAILQLTYMSGLAYVLALITHAVLGWWGVP